MLQDSASERAILSGIINYGLDAWLDVNDLITVNSFTIDSNQIIYKCLEQVYKTHSPKKIDIPTLLSTANSLGLKSFFTKTTELQHLKAIFNSQIELENIREFAKIVKKLEIARLLIIQLEEAKSDVSKILGTESLTEILNLAENRISSVTENLLDKTNEPTPINDGLTEYVQFLAENPTNNVGIPTGFPIYDLYIGGGLRPGGVAMIGARRKIGKTILALNIALFIAQNLNIPVLFLDTEMSKEEQWVRMLAHLTQISKHDIETGKFASILNKKNKITNMILQIKNLPLSYMSIASKTFEETLSIIRRWFQKNIKINTHGIIIYDYFKVMNAKNLASSLQEYQILGNQLTQLNDLCIKYKMACLSFTQLNREGDIAASDRLSWFSSSFSILKEKTQEEIAEDGMDYGNRKLIPVIARHGPPMSYGDYICVDFRGDTASMKEICTKSAITQKDDF